MSHEYDAEGFDFLLFPFGGKKPNLVDNEVGNTGPKGEENGAKCKLRIPSSRTQTGVDLTMEGYFLFVQSVYTMGSLVASVNSPSCI